MRDANQGDERALFRIDFLRQKKQSFFEVFQPLALAKRYPRRSIVSF
ncbi:hypothetical protein [Siminovitchia fordii]|nr:hypothetical protein [Siminovitchia fordii]